MSAIHRRVDAAAHRGPVHFRGGRHVRRCDSCVWSPGREGPDDRSPPHRKRRRHRVALGPRVSLLVDYNRSPDVAEARRRIPRLEAEGLEWIEEPV